MFAFAWLTIAGAGSAARAQDQGVKPRATVEVLDDKAEIDEVIARLQKSGAQHAPPSDAELKSARPPLQEALPNEKKAPNPAESKNQLWRRPQRERGSGAPERTERPRRARP